MQYMARKELPATINLRKVHVRAGHDILYGGFIMASPTKVLVIMDPCPLGLPEAFMAWESNFLAQAFMTSLR